MNIEKYSFNFSADRRYKIPQVNIDTSYYDYVHLGEDNKLPYTILDKYIKSGTLNRIITTKTSMSINGEINIESDDEKLINNTEKFLNNINPHYTLKELMVKVFNDFYLYGGSYLKIYWNAKKTKIVQIYHLPYQKMRAGKANNMNIITKYGFYKKEDEINIATHYDEFKWFDSFNKNNGSKEQVLFIKKDDPTNIYYPYPDWIGAMIDFDTEIEIKNFHNSNIYNGINPGIMVLFDGNMPDQETQDEIYNDIENMYMGSDNPGRFIIMYKRGLTPEFKVIENPDLDKKFEILEKTTKNNITIASQMDRILLSLDDSNGFSNAKEINETSEIFSNRYIVPWQNLFFNQINKILNINKLSQIKMINPTYNMDVSNYGIDDLLLIFDSNEVRGFFGKAEDEYTEEVAEDGDVKEDGDTEIIEEEKQSKLKKLIKKIWKK